MGRSAGVGTVQALLYLHLRRPEARGVSVILKANRRLERKAGCQHVELGLLRRVLTQIIVEEEAKGQSMLPVSFLRHLISFYGDSLQVIVPRYLEYTMQMFARNQEQMREYMGSAFDGLVPFGTIEEMGKHQMAIFEQAMRMFSPFQGLEQASDHKGGGESHSVTEEQIGELRSRVNHMQKQLDALSSRRRAR